MLSLGTPRRRRATFPTILLLACVFGCPGNDEQPLAEPPSTPPLRILVVADEPLAESIRREWTAAGRGDVTVKVATSEDLQGAKRLLADCIIYPSSMLGELVENGLVVPLPNDALASDVLNRADFFPSVRHRETTWGRKAYAVPFGSPTLSLLYRKDVLEKLGRSPPRTWQEYGELAQLLASSPEIADVRAVSEGDFRATVEPLAGPAAAEMLLARAAGYARHPDNLSVLFDDQTMEPLIAGPPFVRALTELAETNTSDSLKISHADARRALLAGECFLALTWPTQQTPDGATGSLEIACAPLPGATDVFHGTTAEWTATEEPAGPALLGVAGRLGSVTNSARHTTAAASALVWLASAEICPRVAKSNPDCSLSRSSQIAGGNAWVAKAYGDAGKQYAEVLQEQKSSNLWYFSIRIPGRDRYLQALADAVAAAVNDEKTPESALTDAAGQWRQITTDLGINAQRDAYARNLGMDR